MSLESKSFSAGVLNGFNKLKQSDITKNQIFDIVQAVQKINTMVSEISATTDNESDGAIHINETIMRMDETRQQNSALVEQAAAAAKSLEDQAIALDTIVAKYRIS